MRQTLKDIYYSLPVQLFLLHFRKHQVLLIFWFILFSTVNSQFLENYGADALFLSPEYLNRVNALSAAIVGVAMGIFMMSWNITTFILHSKRYLFLATSDKPFLKYCINNAVLPLFFLLFFFARVYTFNKVNELMQPWQMFLLITGFLSGFVFILAFSFAYFFGAEKTIQRRIAPIISASQHLRKTTHEHAADRFAANISYFIGKGMRLRKTRPISHYNPEFIESVFKKHHISGIISIVLAFVFLILVGFFMDHPVFQVPAAASLFIFFAGMTAVFAALSYFLQSWSVMFFLLLGFVLNLLYKNEIIDTRNKAYGVNYENREERPDYDEATLLKLCTADLVTADRNNMISILNNWKRKQPEEKPVMYFINVSGGGLRSGTFVMNTLQKLDSATKGTIMKKTMLITGASGGMMGAAYFRELYDLRQQQADMNLQSPIYTNNISKDVLNPLFSSMITRDVFSPVQKFKVDSFRYVKDRGYSFEQKFNSNCGGIMGKQIKQYTEKEKNASMPMMIFNSTINRDGRRMMISTQPISFLMKPMAFLNDTAFNPDAVDFAALFVRQNPMNIRLLTALRMNATFPYVLPNVLLPSKPVIDVMDAGFRDNIGQSTTLRFIENFRDWIEDNTGGVVIIQIRDRNTDSWNEPFVSGSITDIVITPATMLQNNWNRLQHYNENEEYSYLAEGIKVPMHRINFTYLPQEQKKGATLNFHLTAREKRDVVAAFKYDNNQVALSGLMNIMYIPADSVSRH